MLKKIYWFQTKSTGQNFEIYWSDLSDLSHVCHLYVLFISHFKVDCIKLLSFQCFMKRKPGKYTQQEKKRKKLLLLNILTIIKYVEFKKYLLHVKLTVYYTISFTCNIHFLKLTYCTARQCSPSRRKFMECSMINPALLLLMKYLVIGQHQ